MRGRRIAGGFLVLLSVLALSCEKKPTPISAQYPAEVSALDTKGGPGLPYFAGKDLRPVWNLEDAPKPRSLLDFELTDQMGRKVRADDLKGKVSIVSFFFRQCPGVCPLIMRNLHPFQSKFLKDDRVVMISMSVTPESDTVKNLQAYAKKNKIQSAKWHLLTGNRKKIYSLARESFGADTFSKSENATRELTEADFLHSENVYLLDGDLKLRGVYMGRIESSINELIRDTETLIQ